MSLTRAQRAAYPENWDVLSRWVRFVRAGGRCECPGPQVCRAPGHAGHARCTKRHGDMLPGRPTGVVLTTMHLDQNVANNEPSNLRAGCEACHLSFDAHWRAVHGDR